MNNEYRATQIGDEEYSETVDQVAFDFGPLTPSRREVVAALGIGLLIAVSAPPALGQARGGRRGGGGFGGGNGAGRPISARLHIAKDGMITVLTGKVEAGQGARAELTQAAAEELAVKPEQVTLLMADTALVPDDGITAGSRSTPSSVPAIRQGAAAARELLIAYAAGKWEIDKNKVSVRDGKAMAEGKKELSYGDLASAEDSAKLLDKPVGQGVSITALKDWKVLGKTLSRPNKRDLVTGKHQYPSDIQRPGMWYGKVLRPPSYGANLTSIDVAAAQAMKDVIVVRDGSFVGVAAATAYLAEMALEELAKAAKWEHAPHPSSRELFTYLREHARGIPANPYADDLAKAAKSLKQTYHVAYIQHTPMEPRAAVAEWENGKVTVWTGTQNPFGCKGEVARAFGLGNDAVRLIVPDFGGAFGGKHTGECAVEATRLAKGAGKPVSLRWTRAEEFTWAYFRPAGVIDAQASLDDKGQITSWYYININSGGNAVESPYRTGKARSQFVQSNPPLRHGSYRGLAATANTFGREVFMDELAILAGRDPLEFRLAHLDAGRLKNVLEAAAKGFGWADRIKQKQPNTGIGLACGTEKGSFVACCAEVAIEDGKIKVKRVSQAYECGAILNPDNLKAQVEGAIVMGIGPALREEMRFEEGKMLNATFESYLVPRISDLPELDIQLLDRPDLPSVGAGETPLITIAPAIANAVFNATGTRVREMPIRLPVAKPA
jgi:CO/xanthine dehydrogenase Mo-binding subunit